MGLIHREVRLLLYRYNDTAFIADLHKHAFFK